MRLRFSTLVAFALCAPVIVQVQGCKESNPLETVSVSLKNTDVYQYPTVGGDEDGVRISTTRLLFISSSTTSVAPV